MNPTRTLAATAAALMIALTAACGLQTSSTNDEARSAQRQLSGLTPPPAPAGPGSGPSSAAPATRTVPCPSESGFGDAACGFVTVPLDRQSRSAGSLEVFYALLAPLRPTTTAPRTVAFLFGGPGPGLSTNYASFWYPQARQRFFTDRHVLLVDVRGSGRSGALHCPAFTLNRDQPEQAAACADQIGPNRVHYNHVEMADDLDDVRAALGVPRLDLLGSSDGTLLAQAFAARHPAQVGRMVLDGAFPLSGFGEFQEPLHDAAIRVLDAYCARNPTCSPATLRRDLNTVTDQLRQRARPLRSEAPDTPVAADAVLDPSVLAALLENALDRDDLITAVQHAARGDWRPLEAAAVDEVNETPLDSDPTVDSRALLLTAVCNDWAKSYDLAAPPDQRRTALSARAKEFPPDAFEPFTAEEWVARPGNITPDRFCLSYPADTGVDPLPTAADLAGVPTLVVSGTLDTATPVEEADRTRRQFPDAAYLEVADTWHTPLGFSSCAVGAAAQYLRSGSRPAPDACREPFRPDPLGSPLWWQPGG